MASPANPPTRGGPYTVVVLLQDGEILIAPWVRPFNFPEDGPATIRWVLAGPGLDWNDQKGGVVVVDSDWDSDWGQPSKIGQRYELELPTGPEANKVYKYDVYVTENDVPVDIDPGIKYDPDF